MFLEPSYRGQRSGWIEIITGCMFSGKSEELIRRLKRAQIANQSIICFKPVKDDRYADEQVVSHDSNAQDSIAIVESSEIFKHITPLTTVVGIDEGQFFDMAVIEAANDLANNGKRVIIAGLDQDFMGKPFEPMPQLLSIAEFITKTHAICVKCGATANYSQRTFESNERVEVGAGGKYEARCRKCFIPHSDKPTIHE